MISVQYYKVGTTWIQEQDLANGKSLVLLETNKGVVHNPNYIDNWRMIGSSAAYIETHTGRAFTTVLSQIWFKVDAPLPTATSITSIYDIQMIYWNTLTRS